MNSFELTTNTRGFLLIIVIFVLSSVGSVYYLQNEIEGCARVVNYSGIVRGISQRLVKLEIANTPSDEFIEEIDEIINGLINGSHDLDLPRAEDTHYSMKLRLVEKSWNEIKTLIFQVRKSPDTIPLLLEKSERFFSLTNEAVFAAEDFSKRKVENLTYLQIVILIIVSLILFGVWIVSQMKITKTQQSLVESEDILRETQVKLEKSEKIIQVQKDIKAFITTAQYLANLTSYQNVKSEIIKIIRNEFKADIVCFVGRNIDGKLYPSENQEENSSGINIVSENILAKISDVIDSEFLNTVQITHPEPYSMVIFPLKVGNKVNDVIVIGHKSSSEISNAMLGIYLGVSSLAGTMINRLALHSKLEDAYQTLEHKVEERTKELSEKNKQLRNYEQRLKAEHQILQESHQRLKDILDELPFAVVLIDRNRKIRWLNQKLLCLLKGQEENQIIGKDCGDFLCPIPDTECPVLDLGNNMLNVESYLVTRQNKKIPIIKSALEINIDGEDLILESFVDITARKKLEQELFLARKLESVGQLAAGIAHEINTPAQFIGSNLDFINDSIKDILDLVNHFSDVLGGKKEQTISAATTSSIETMLEDIDWEYLQEELPLAVRQSLDGIKHISKIVLAMKELSHPGTKEKNPENLNMLLDTALTVTSSEWKNAADIDLDLAPDLAAVKCFKGGISQVFINIIVNAAQAIQEHKGNEKGLIKIFSEYSDKWVVIKIEDNGGGIPETAQEHIFDPFFTTKEVGKGTGQGLAIAFDVVVSKHDGNLEFETVEGEGTTFIIKLPVV